MDENSHCVDPEKSVEASLDPIPPPAHPETMPEKTGSLSSEDAQEREKTEQTTQSDIPEPEYPSMAKVIPIVVALYSAFFLVALVLQPPTPLPNTHD